MKPLLLDTHVFTWWLTNDRALGEKTKDKLMKRTQSVYASAITSWETAIQRSLGKLIFDVDIQEAMEKNRFFPLTIIHTHAQRAGDLP